MLLIFFKTNVDTFEIALSFFFFFFFFFGAVPTSILKPRLYFFMIGVKTVAIPCEISGLWKAHQRYGKLTWPQLFEPVISLARNGYLVTKHLAYVVRLSSTPDEIV